MNENEFRYQVGKYFNINNTLTFAYLEYFGGIPFIHIELGDEKHIYFRQIRYYHTVDTFDNLNKELLRVGRRACSIAFTRVLVSSLCF